MDRKPDSPRIFIPPPLILLGMLLAGLALDGRLGSLSRLSPIPTVMGIVITLMGLGVIAAALRLFGSAGTRAEPWKRASALVTDGIYQHTRNPMYLGMVLIYGGVALAQESLTSLILLVPLCLLIDRLIIAREERYLSRRFGAEYDVYRSHVRRWI